jgi:hypothetical protein
VCAEDKAIGAKEMENVQLIQVSNRGFGNLRRTETQFAKRKGTKVFVEYEGGLSYQVAKKQP